MQRTVSPFNNNSVWFRAQVGSVLDAYSLQYNISSTFAGAVVVVVVAIGSGVAF